MFSGSDVASRRLVSIRDGVDETALAGSLVQLLRAFDEIGDVVAKVSDGGERVDISRRRLLASSLLLGKRYARKQIFFDASASLHTSHFALGERALRQIFVAESNLFRSFANLSGEFLRA